MSITFTATAAGAPEINMSNINATAVLDLLGLGSDAEQVTVLGVQISYSEGEVLADDFLGRLLLALALVNAGSDNELGRPDVQDGRLWIGGRRPGYLARRLAELHHLGEWAKAHHADVMWS